MADAKGQAEGKESAGKSKKNTGKLLLIIGIAVLLLGGGGGAAWFMLKGKPHGDSQAEAQAKYKEALKHRVYVPLDAFTVNLADDKESRLAQISMVLQVRDNELAEEIKAMMPSLRNRILLILSAKQSRDLLSVDGKEELARQIADATATLTGHAPKSGKKKKAKAPEADDKADKDSHGDKDAAADKEGAAEKDGAGEDDDAEAVARPSIPEIPLVSVNFAQFIVQ